MPSEIAASLPGTLPHDATAFASALAAMTRRFEAMQPEMEVTVRDPALDLEGYVVVWNTGISVGGPLERSGKGGTRITPGLTLDEVKMLARVMALKNAAAGLPLGGAKSGLKGDPAAEGFERVYRRFVRLCAPLLHERGGPFGGFGFDLGARPEHAVWACDELGSTRAFTGKPLSMGGTDYDREGIAGLGVAVAGATLLEDQGQSPFGATFSVQGAGAMGAAVIRHFGALGARLVAVGDPRLNGTWRLANAPSAELCAALAQQHFDAALARLPREAAFVSNSGDQALFAEADIVFPCAVQHVVTERNARSLRTRRLCEGANSAIAPGAYALLHAAGVAVVPDFIANAGGVIAAYVELTSSAPDKVDAAKRLTREKVADNVRLLQSVVRRFACDPRDAALYIALTRLFGGTGEDI